MYDVEDSMRLKTKVDTFFIPDAQGGVYFRNNEGSFRMQGGSIEQWIEKLWPAFNGERSLAELTDGLPLATRNRVYDIAQVLYKNGFLRDVSQDRAHDLSAGILNHFAAQIEFLNYFGDSGAYRFQSYRQLRVLAIGAGFFLSALVSALFHSGLSHVHVWLTESDTAPSTLHRLRELEAHVRKVDPVVTLTVEQLPSPAQGVSWQNVIVNGMFDAVFYGSEVENEQELRELRTLETICQEQKTLFLPALRMHQLGLAGPVVGPNLPWTWDSAFRRLHRSVVYKDPQVHVFSTPAAAVLANVLVFELFKIATAVPIYSPQPQVFLLNLETMEGDWHAFVPYPLDSGHPAVTFTQPQPDSLLFGVAANLSLSPDKAHDEHDVNALLTYFGELTSAETGIFHRWEEGNLSQLPLAQCCVQVVDPLSSGPANLLPELVGVGLTHSEARREAALAGIELYVSKLQPFVGVGAGGSVSEAVSRGLQHQLQHMLGQGTRFDLPTAEPELAVCPVELLGIEDEPCRFYWQALTTLQGTPEVGVGPELYGFPVVCVRVAGHTHMGVDFTFTLALRRSLRTALRMAHNPSEPSPLAESEPAETQLEPSPKFRWQVAQPQGYCVPEYEEAMHREVLRSALAILQEHGLRIRVADLALEPFLQTGLGAVVGILLEEEEGR